MSARSGLVGKKSSWPYLGPSEAIFSMDRKNQKLPKICLFSLVGQWAPIHPVWALADIMSSEPRHWMVFDQLFVGVECSTASPDQLVAFRPVPWFR